MNVVMIHLLAILNRLSNGNILGNVSSNSNSTHLVGIKLLDLHGCEKLGKNHVTH